MGFARHATVKMRQGYRSPISIWCLRFLALLMRAFLALSIILTITALVVLARLHQGPIALPGIANIVAERVNASTPGTSLRVENAVFSLGDGEAPSGLQFLNVEVRSASDELLFKAPRIAASFLAEDVVLGRFQPIRISLLQPTLEILRDSEGRFRVGLTTDAPASSVSQTPAVPSTDRFDMLADALDSFVGDKTTYPQLSRLSEIRVVGADLTYVDEIAAHRWQTQDAGIRISKHDRGVRAILTLDEIAGDEAGLSLRVLADRLSGTGETLLTLQFGRVAAKALSDQAPGLEWMDLIEGEIEGRASAVVERNGGIRDLSGTIVAENGALDLNGDAFPYDFARLDFAIDPGGQSVEIREFTATSKNVGVRMNAIADLSFDEEGDFAGIALDAELDRLSLALPEVFDQPLDFDAAGVTARWDRTSNEIEIASADLRAKQTTYNLSGRLAAGETTWLGDLRMSAVDTSIASVLQLWPLAAAGNAREWVDQNILRASISELLANVRFGNGQPTLALDFAFDNLDATYLADMTPLRSVSGNGHVDYHGLALQIDNGYVQPRNQSRIALAGSRVSITGFWADVTDADIYIAGDGAVQSVVSLIDQKPLRLIRKLGVDLGPVQGTAKLDVDLAFPLEDDLLLEDVGVVAVAQLSDLGLDYDVPAIGKIRVEANNATLRADTNSMSLAGAVQLDGVPSQVKWQENYGSGRSGRSLELESTANANLFARLDVDPSLVSGEVPFDLLLTQNASKPLQLAIDADLENARVALDGLGWEKAPGTIGRLQFNLLPEKGVVFDRVQLDASDLRAEGRVELDDDGNFRLAEFSRLALRRTFDVSASVQQAGPSQFSASIDGEYLNLVSLLDRQEANEPQAAEPGPTIDATIDLERLIATEAIRLNDVSGLYRRAPSGAMSAEVAGSLAGSAPIEVELTRSASKAGQLVVTGQDAGQVLRAMDLYDDANGGKLTLTADLDTQADLDGIIRIEDLQIGDGSSFQQVLRGGGFEDAETFIETTGLSFRKVWIPFATSGGSITLKDAIASGTALALKVNGSVDQENGNLDLRGVISPAYGLTGALDNVPLLGTLLSGGEGEGIFAMTFTLSGPSNDPELAINPLSILTPGILRNVFEGESSNSSESFRQQIQRSDR